MRTETYVVKQGTQGDTSITYYAATDCVYLDEWAGKPIEELNAAMGRKPGFKMVHKEETKLSMGTMIEWTWIRA